MKATVWLLAALGWLASAEAAPALENVDRHRYNNKMALLGVLLDGARERAMDTGDLETLCLLIGISNDVTLRYAQLNPNDELIKPRLDAIGTDLSACLSMLERKEET